MFFQNIKTDHIIIFFFRSFYHQQPISIGLAFHYSNLSYCFVRTTYYCDHYHTNTHQHHTPLPHYCHNHFHYYYSYLSPSTDCHPLQSPLILQESALLQIPYGFLHLDIAAASSGDCIGSIVMIIFVVACFAVIFAHTGIFEANFTQRNVETVHHSNQQICSWSYQQLDYTFTGALITVATAATAELYSNFACTAPR